MADKNDNKSDDFSVKMRQQIEFQQSEEALRKIRTEISNLEIQIRKYHQDFTRAKMTFDDAEAKLKILKSREFELAQNAAKQKKAYISSMSKK